MSNKLKIIFFLLGAAFICVACLILIKPLSPNSFKTRSIFELGILNDQVGSITIQREKETLESKSGSKIYSGDVITLAADAEVTVNIGTEQISVIGPATFELAFPKQDTRDVFLNFTAFTKTELIDQKPEHIWLTYNNWYIEPGYDEQITQEENYKSLSLPTKEDLQKGEPKSSDKNTSVQSQEATLEEAIGTKRLLLKRCYENYLKKNPQATGELIVEFTVQTSGKVSASRIAKSNFINDTLFKTCISDVFRKIKSRPFSGEPLLVSYPISFE